MAVIVPKLLVFIFFLLTTPLLVRRSFADDEKEEKQPTTSNCAQKLAGVNTKLLPFDTSSLKCNSPWSSQDFTLMYEGREGSWNFLLSAPDKDAYISIGFSPNGKMVGSSAVVGWKMANGKGMARQYYLGGEVPDLCNVDKGDLVLVKGKTLLLSQSSRLWLAFQLNVTTKPKDRLIYAIGPKGRIPGADLVLAEHAHMISTTINYESGDGEEESSENMLKTHKFLAIIGWGVLVPIGVLVARYAKGWDPLWFYSHLLIQLVGFGLGIGAIVTGLKLEDDGEEGDDVDKHKAIGITILVLGALQVMAVLARPKKESKVRRYWNWYHHNIGRAAIILAIANIFYGLHIAHEEKQWRIGYGVFLGVWALVAVILDIMMLVKKR